MTGTTVDATTFKADGSAWTPMVQPYVRSGATATIRGYFPWRNASATAGNAGPALTSWTVSQDQTSDANYQSSDLMYAEAVNIGTDGKVQLEFHHRMARVIVKVTNTIGATIQAVNLVQGYRTVSIQTPSELVPGTALSDPIGQTTPLNVSTGAVPAGGVACLVPPQKILKDQRLIEVVSNMGTAYFALTADQTLAGGTEYTATVNLNRAALSATVSEIAWTAATMAANEAVKENLVYQVGNAVFQMNFVKGGAYSTLRGTSAYGTLSDFYMAQTETTQALWKACGLTVNDQNTSVGDNYPIVYTSQTEISTFISTLNSELAARLPAGWAFALPTEAQWEYAARGGQPAVAAGTYTDQWPGTNSASNLTEYSYYSHGSAKNPVGRLKPNELGLYDMSGNAWEIVRDYDNSDVTNGKNLGHDWVSSAADTGDAYHGDLECGGGTYQTDANSEKVTSRGQGITTNVGFRLALVRGHMFGYTGAVQTLSVPAGTYRIEAWGAEGGQGNRPPGAGGHASVVWQTATATTLYVYVGGKGGNNSGKTPGKGGWNGGGTGSKPHSSSNKAAGGGGGASHVSAGTDVGLITASNNLWSTATAIDAITAKEGLLLVAGGGGGSSADTEYPGSGGGLTGGFGGSGLYSGTKDFWAGQWWSDNFASQGSTGGDCNISQSWSKEGGAGGGGGFVGGNARKTFANAQYQNASGCGGSSWGASGAAAGGTASGFSTTAGVRRGHGLVIISRVGD